MKKGGWFSSRLFYGFLVVGLPASVVTQMWLPVNPSLLNSGAIFSALLLFPILEELTFRGFLQGMVKQKVHYQWRGLSLANLLVSSLFMVAHIVWLDHWLLSLVLLPSLVFGYCRDRYQSTLPGMVLHGCYNGFYLVVGSIFYG